MRAPAPVAMARTWVITIAVVLATAGTAMAHGPISGPDHGPVNAAMPREVDAGATAASPGTRSVTGRVRIAVVLVRPPGERTRITHDGLQSLVFGGGANSVRSQFLAMSAGRASLTGRVYGAWSVTSSQGGCAWCLQQAVASKARSRGVDLSTYAKVVIVVDNGYNWGLGQLGGRWAWMWTCDCDPDFQPASVVYRHTFVHELGHTFGLHHARSRSCTDALGAPASFGASCSNAEYGDQYDAMGRGTGANYSTSNRRFLGWLDSTRIHTVGASGTFSITSGSDLTSGIKLLRIPRRNAAGAITGYLELETRQTTGYDGEAYGNNTGIAYDASTDGVLLRLVELRASDGTMLVDANPQTQANERDRPLALGQSITDPVSGATITLDSFLLGAATVTVRL